MGTLPLIFSLTLLWSCASAQQQGPSWACIDSIVPGKPSQKVCADKSCNPIPAQLGGKILVLSVGSMIYLHGGYAAPGSDPADCCARCRTTDNCNAWSFCSQPGGCGEPNSCTDYVKTLPANATGGNAGNRKLPAVGFGQYGPGCVKGNGTFPYQMCTLRTLEDAISPEVTAFGVGARGWISGVLPRTAPALPGCPVQFGNQTCRKCLASKSPSKCFLCMSEFQLLEGTADNCAACASLNKTAARDTCVACLKDFPTLTDGCSSCLQFQSYNAKEVDVEASEACFACVEASGPARRKTPACSNCFNFNNGDMNLQQCLTCAANTSLSAMAASACYACHNSQISDSKGCMSCLRQFPAGSSMDLVDQAVSCGGCATVYVQRATKECFACVKNAGRSGASYCSNLGVPPDTDIPKGLQSVIPSYYSCLKGTSFFADGGSFCFGCLSEFVTSEASRRSCLQCVTSLKQKPWAQLCSNCYGTDLTTRPEQCRSCLSRATSMNAGNKCIV